MTAPLSAAAGTPGRPRRWFPPPAVYLSLAVHALALSVVAWRPEHWPAALTLLLGNHLALATAVMLPRSAWLGENLTRLPAAAAARAQVALTFDDGPDPVVTPQVLDWLDRFQARASFFLPALRAAAHPEVVREIVRRGHSVENHSLRHAHAFSLFGWRALSRDVGGAQAILTEISGRPPMFFRAPAGFRNVLLDPLLVRLGLRYVSWTRRGLDGVSGNAERVLARLSRGLAAGDILLLHDTDRIRTADGVPVVLAVLPALLERLRAAGLQSVTLPQAFGG